MFKIINKSKFLFAFVILAFSFSYTTSHVEAQSSDKPKKQIKYKKARALQSKTAKKRPKTMRPFKRVRQKGSPKL